MASLISKTLKEDVDLLKPSSSLWRLSRSKPQIKQIYGHFLPPYHRKLVRGLVAKDFNFPAAYHAVVNSSDLDELYAIGKKLSPNTIVSISDSVKIRAEKNGGAVVYTRYFNGFYMNESAYEILKCCKDKVSVAGIVSEIGFDLETVSDFLARTLILGIINVYS